MVRPPELGGDAANAAAAGRNSSHEPTGDIPITVDPRDDTPVRRIIHVDMDAFFASVEQRDNLALRGKPVAVGGSSLRGVVAAASYEARRFGVRSAMPSVRAARLCPDLIFVKSRFDIYKEVSRQIRAIFLDYTPLVEPLSLDEAYLDVTDYLNGRTATAIAREIRARIVEATQLTASAGVSYNKFLAKLASDQRKPNGLFVIPPEAGPGYVQSLPVSRFHGIGPATAAKMEGLGLRTGADLLARDEAWLTRHFGKAGRHYWRIARGIDHRQVRPNRIRKSVGAENTFAADIHSYLDAAAALAPLAAKVWRHCAANGVRGRTVTLKAKYSDFQIVTRTTTLPRWVEAEAELLSLACAQLPQIIPDPRGVRLLGVTLSHLAGADGADKDERQLGLDL